MTSPESVLNRISREYQTHRVQIQKIEHAIKQQEDMMRYRTIPKLYRPQVLTTVNSNEALVADFNKEYKDLFFKHLERVITNNNITLQIHKARVDNVLSQFDQYLCDLKTPPQHKRELYDSFIKDNRITEESETQLEIRKMLPRALIGPTTSTTTASTPPCESPAPHHYQPKPGKKRKTSKPHPKAKKVTKQHPFLSQSLTKPQQPP